MSIEPEFAQNLVQELQQRAEEWIGRLNEDLSSLKARSMDLVNSFGKVLADNLQAGVADVAERQTAMIVQVREQLDRELGLEKQKEQERELEKQREFEAAKQREVELEKEKVFAREKEWRGHWKNALKKIRSSVSQRDVLGALLDASQLLSGAGLVLIVKKGAVTGWDGRGFDEVFVENFKMFAAIVDEDFALNETTLTKGVQLFSHENTPDYRSTLDIPGFLKPSRYFLAPLCLFDAVSAFLYLDGDQLTEKEGIVQGDLELLMSVTSLWLENLAMRKSLGLPVEIAAVQAEPVPYPAPAVAAVEAIEEEAVAEAVEEVGVEAPEEVSAFEEEREAPAFEEKVPVPEPFREVGEPEEFEERAEMPSLVPEPVQEIEELATFEEAPLPTPEPVQEIEELEVVEEVPPPTPEPVQEIETFEEFEAAPQPVPEPVQEIEELEVVEETPEPPVEPAVESVEEKAEEELPPEVSERLHRLETAWDLSVTEPPPMLEEAETPAVEAALPPFTYDLKPEPVMEFEPVAEPEPVVAAPEAEEDLFPEAEEITKKQLGPPPEIPVMLELEARPPEPGTETVPEIEIDLGGPSVDFSPAAPSPFAPPVVLEPPKPAPVEEVEEFVFEEKPMEEILLEEKEEESIPTPPSFTAFRPPEPAPPVAPPAAPPVVAAPAAPLWSSPEEERLHVDAKRFARLLVSEIKLYNEESVAEGRVEKDLYRRLRRDIDRSREMYDKRVSGQVSSKIDYFHEELVRILGENDGNRMGTEYPGPQITS